MNSTAAAMYGSAAEAGLSLRGLNAAGRRVYLLLFFCEHVLGQERFARWLGGARAHNRARMGAYLAGWPQDETRPVREVAFRTHAEFYRGHVPVWEPAVFRGVAREWPAVRQWSFDYFAQHFAETPAVMGDQHGLFGAGESGRYEVSTLGKLIAAIRAGERRCLRFSPVIEENPVLKGYLDMRWFSGFRGPLSLRGLAQLFVAPGGTYTPVHCALESNVFVQVYGRKRWVLHAARYQPLLEPPADRRPYFHTDYLPGRRSPHFPLAPYAPAYEVVLNPGDVLYFPPFVWHYVENLDATIAVAYRFFSLRTALRSSWPLTVAKFMATKPSLLHTLYYSLTKTNFYYKPRVD
jgi:hypothetical protein